ncbi:hypothetical protein EJ04DRAFT_164380 [Polyplosphaeria fusca]|uniref:Uncharacterized protein n=1 Tax=Polyplosphaeria fusca TaxID=682080 RepID=A0A9P4RB61_9PLEO|nr:hypothetical protein EJ04DRAFT_164380 [Polyplosphaeria fusca]
MSLFLSSLLLAATATAQVTTSIRMPGNLDDYDVGYYASVVGNSDGALTLALQYDNDTDIDALGVYENAPETATLKGATWFESVVTTTDPFENNAAMTMSLACQMPTAGRAKPTCVYSMGGELAFSSYCSDYSTYTDVYTTTYVDSYSSDEFGPATEYTYTETVDYGDYIPEFCTEGSTLPESIAVETVTLSKSYIGTYQVVITAGEEKLDATAAAAPSSGASQTASTTGAAPAPTGANGTVTSGTASAPPQGTGAAPLMTMAPALVGLGAAIAAFL